MLTKIKQHLSYANVMCSLLADCVVLGGGMAVAAGLKKDSVEANGGSPPTPSSRRRSRAPAPLTRGATNAATGAKLNEASLGQACRRQRSRIRRRRPTARRRRGQRRERGERPERTERGERPRSARRGLRRQLDTCLKKSPRSARVHRGQFSSR